MGVISIKKLREANVLFAISLPNVIYNLYDISISERAFENALKLGLGIDEKRVVKLVEAVAGEKHEILLLVIYDKIATDDRTFLKESINLKVESFDFDIYNYDFNMVINIEEQIRLQKGSV